jgi:hypothetical protein
MSTTTSITNQIGGAGGANLVSIQVTVNGGTPTALAYGASTSFQWSASSPASLFVEFIVASPSGNPPSLVTVAPIGYPTPYRFNGESKILGSFDYTGPYSYLGAAGYMIYDGTGIYVKPLAINLNTMLALPPFGYTDSGSLSGCFTGSVNSFLPNIPFVIETNGGNYLTASAGSISLTTTVSSYFQMVYQNNNMYLCVADLTTGTYSNSIYVNESNSFAYTNDPISATTSSTWGVFLNYSETLGYANSVTLVCNNSGGTGLNAIVSLDAIKAVAAGPCPASAFTSPPCFFNVGTTNTAGFQLQLYLADACVARPYTVNCWGITNLGCPYGQPYCTVQATSTGGELCFVGCTGGTSTEVSAAQKFVSSTCLSRDAVFGIDPTCSAVAGVTGITGCTQWLSQELGPSCSAACAFIQGASPSTPSYCDLQKTAFCGQSGQANTPDCSCLNVYTTTFKTAAVNQGGVNYSYNDFACYVQDQLFGQISPNTAFYPECWWPTCLATGGGLVLDPPGPTCPSAWVGCFNLISDVFENNQPADAAVKVTNNCGVGGESGQAPIPGVPLCGPRPPAPPLPVLPPGPKKRLSKNTLYIIIGAAAGVVVLILGLGLGLGLRNRNRKKLVKPQKPVA